MKITEITEGWGEYSNKSNHNMNKFKREETDEAFADAWSTVKKGASAVGGSLGRGLERGSSAIGAKMGSGKAQGAQKVQQATLGVYKNFQRYLGQSGSKPTVGALKQYMSALGIKDPVFEAVPSQAKIAQAKAKKDAGLAGSTVAGMKDTDILNKNQLIKIIANNIQNALKTGTLPKEIQKFLSS